MNAPDSIANIRTLLKNPSLFHEDALINGQWVKASENARFAVSNPATGEIIAKVANLNRSDAQEAISAAELALNAWKGKLAKERAQVMRKWFELILANADDLALLMTLEQGKPLAEAKGEVIYGASFVEWFAEEAKRVMGAIPATTWGDKRTLVLKQAIGGVLISSRRCG